MKKPDEGHLTTGRKVWRADAISQDDRTADNSLEAYDRISGLCEVIKSSRTGRVNGAKIQGRNFNESPKKK